MRSKPAFRFLLPFLLLPMTVPLQCLPASANPETRFFSMSDEWNRRFQYLGEEKTALKDVGFIKGQDRTKSVMRGAAAKYFERDESTYSPIAPPPPPPETIDIAELRGLQQKNIELYVDQVLTVNGRGIERYLATDADVVEFFAGDPAFLQIKGVNVGSTFVHIWDGEGRLAVRIRVTRAPIIPDRTEARRIEVMERGEPLKVQYSQSRSAFYEGNSFENIQRSSLNFDQYLDAKGDLPFGHMDAQVAFRRIANVGNDEFSSGVVHLKDAQIGPFSDFDLALGDERVDTGLLTVPTLRLRGADVIHRSSDDRSGFNVFYGRELPSVIGTTIQGGKIRDIDSFVGGGIYDFKPSDAAMWKVAYAQAYGQQRGDELNDAGMEFIQQYKLGEHVVLDSDFAYDTEHVAHMHGVAVSIEKVNMKLKYRDISNEFFTLIGNPSFQGEQGVRLDMVIKPQQDIELTYLGDAFRDRLFPAPGEIDRFNVTHDASATFHVNPRGNLTFEIYDKDETGRITPIRDRVHGVGYTQGFRFWEREMSLFARLQDKDFENLKNPVLNFRNQRLLLGLQTRLFWDIVFSVQPQFHYLEETENRRITHPHGTAYSLTRGAQIGKTPFYLDLAARWHDEEEADSDRSFLTGEDRFELSGGVRYRIEEMEFFVDGRYTGIEGDNLTLEPVRSEAEINTGFRYLFDTGVRWEPSGHFEGAVFNDLNADGVRQPEEPGIPDMGIVASGNEVLADAEGRYRTPVIVGKRATLTVMSEKIPPGFVLTTPSSVTVPIRFNATERVDFGLVAKSFIFGYVFNDLNANGRYDMEDKGIPGARVTLDDKLQIYTGSRGAYRFPEAVTGPHKVLLDVQTLDIGYLPRVPALRQMELYERVSFQLDFPVSAERTVAGRVFLDKDKSERLEAGEEGVPGAKVMLDDQTVIADSEGYFIFENVAPGTHVISVDPASVPKYRATFKEKITFEAEPQSVKIDLPVSASGD